MKALILAGGKGTRLKDITGDLPKPLVPFGERSLIEHQIALCVRHGFREIHLLTGYGSEHFRSRLGSGEQFGARLHHHIESTPLGTAGSVKEVEDVIGSEPFLLLYGDVFIDMDLERLLEHHRRHAGLATLVVHPNDHPQDSDLLELEGDRIVEFHPKPHRPDHYYFNMVNAGACVLEAGITRHIPRGQLTDFGRDIFPRCLAEGEKLFAYATPEYLKDIGTPQRYRTVLADYLSGRCARLRLDHPRRCVFLDRDGTINTYTPFLRDPADFALLPTVAEAIKLLNDHDWLCVVTTNQPQLARGELTAAGLAGIHRKMEHLLSLGHAKLDATYYCPHHPDAGFPGEVAALKVDCGCRKPKPGMFLTAAQRFNVDLAGSYVVGDTTLDVAAAKAIGARSILVQTGLAGTDGKYTVRPDFTFPDLLAAARHIISSL